MFYCPKCLNIYNITKTLNNVTQSGGVNLDELVTKVLNNENIDDIKLDDLNELKLSSNFKKLSNKQKDFVYNTLSEKVSKHIKNEVPIQRNMYFICKNCGNSESIKEGTMIVSKEKQNTNIDNNSNFNVKEYLNMNVLPRTRQYSCPNDKCNSHKDKNVKSALFMRLPDSYKMRYICEACETVWIYN